jgi:DNA invertase Pin-like site-specific DNA recombinase
MQPAIGYLRVSTREQDPERSDEIPEKQSSEWNKADNRANQPNTVC